MASISSFVIFVFEERGSCHCIRVHEKFYLFFLVVVVVVVVLLLLKSGLFRMHQKQLKLGLRLAVTI